MSTSTEASRASASSADAALASSILAGEAGSFERLMRQYNRRLFRVARSILRDDDEAEDALQEGYIKAHRAIASFRGDARLSTWLTRIVVNQALERRQRVRGEPAAFAADEAAPATADTVPESPETLTMRAELRRLIEHAVDALPEPYRSVFVLRDVEGLSVGETAAALAISEGNTKVRLLRARARLRASLGNRLGPLLEDVFAFDGNRCDRIVARVCARLGLPTPRVRVHGATLAPITTRSSS